MMLEYELFFKYSMDMFVIAGNDGYFKSANPAFCNLLDRSEQELISQPFVELIHPDDVEKVMGALKNLGMGHPAFLVEVRLQAADGTYRSLQWSAYPDPKSGLLFAIARDQNMPNQDAQRLKLLMDSSPTAVFLVEQNGAITYSNHLADTIFGYEKNELIGMPIETLVPKKFHAKHKVHRDQYIASPALRPMGTLQNLVGMRKNGEEFQIDVGLNPVWLERGTTIICSVIDISRKMDYLHKLVKEKDRLGRLADRDGLTGLYNRRAFERILRKELSSVRKAGKNISIIMADIDQFKEFNDEFGHPMGDELLKTLGNVLSNNIRKEDTVARIGGEEFVIVLPGIGDKPVTAFGERLRKVIEKSDWNPRGITVSLGATSYTFASKRTSIAQAMKLLISEADRALYQSKKTGRNRFMHFSDLNS
jgi:diguanylate cyclase (GGDEF)-like protein/PAS domain S-box-containing protein